MSDKKVLFIADEIAPFISKSPIAEFCRTLPLGIYESGHEIRTFMPKWGPINERRNQLHEVIRLSGMNLIVDDSDHPLLIKVASLPTSRIQVYFIDNDDYFQNRQFVCDEKGEEYQDNDERTAFFARGVLETVKKLRWTPDIIHCHGWLSAMIPMYVKTAYKEEPAFRNSKVVYTIPEKSFDREFRDNYAELVLAKDMTLEDVGEFSKPVDFDSVMKKAIDFSDALYLDSKIVSQELLDYAKSKKVLTRKYDTKKFKMATLDALYEKL